tara:strand:- start:1661 stop:1765 length:105 start_codon:yes stop_codon:yes gene_type:complete
MEGLNNIISYTLNSKNKERIINETEVSTSYEQYS